MPSIRRFSFLQRVWKEAYYFPQGFIAVGLERRSLLILVRTGQPMLPRSFAI